MRAEAHMELDLEEGGAVRGRVGWAEKGEKPFCLPLPQTDLRSLDNCLVNACHIKDQVRECGWLRANPDLPSRR